MQKINEPWKIKRSLLVRAEEETDPSFGCKPKNRKLKQYIQSGIINLDKPAGPSSHQVTAWLKRIIGLNRAGHGGTLEA